MATTHGKNGQVRVGSNQVANVTQWNLTYDPGWADTTALQATGADQIAGVIKATGSINCNTDANDDTGQEALKTAFYGQTTARLYLYINTTDYWELNANLDIVDTVDIGDVVKRVVNFRSNGAVILH
jgi:hypothetical protein